MENSIAFTECRLIIDKNEIPQLNLFGNKEEDIYEFDNISYIVNCKIINEKFFWIYVRYGKAKPHSDEVLNTETKEIAPNKRASSEAELRNQLFCMYIPSKDIIYLSDFRKGSFLTTYLKDRFKKEFSLKKYIIEPKKFIEEIVSVESLKFVGASRNLFSESIFNNVDDICGYGQTVSFTLEAKIKSNIFDSEKILNLLLFWKDKKKKGEIKRMICIGKDDKGLEKIFNLEDCLRKIEIHISKDINEMYNSELVKDNLLQKLDKNNDL